MGAGFFVGALAFVHAKAIVAMLAFGIYIVSMPLLTFRACKWAAGFAVKWTPLRARRAVFGRDFYDS